MEKKTVYRFNPKGEEDPSIHYVSEALNRLKSFQNMLEQQFALASIQRIVKYDWFEANDINNAVHAMNRIAEIAEKEAPSSLSPADIIQAADNCRACAVRLKTDFLNGIFGQFA